MTTQQRHGLAEGLSDKEVIEYLQTHPDFFITHTHLLADLVVPHESGGAVSLIERQVAVLRDQNRHVRRELADLVQIARDNDRLNDCLQRFAVAVMGCATLSEIFSTLYDTLRSDLNADAVSLRLFGEAAFFRNFDGTADNALVMTGSGALEMGSMTYSLAYSQQRTLISGGTDSTAHLIHATAMYDLGDTLSLAGEKWSVGAGYSFSRADGENVQTIGLKLSTEFGGNVPYSN